MKGFKLTVDFVAIEDCDQCLGYALVCENVCDTILELISLASEKDYIPK